MTAGGSTVRGNVAATPTLRNLVPVEIAAIFLLAAFCGLRLWAAAEAGFFFDEAYYWSWSTELAAGYRDHPPMVAYVVWAGTQLFGQTTLGARFGSIVCHVLSVALVYGLARDLYGDRRTAAWAAILANLTLFAAFSIIIYPEQPMVAAWLAAMYGLTRIANGGRPAWWVFVGAMFGLSFASKYSAFVALLGALLWVAMAAETRGWFRRPGPYVAAAVAALVFMPVAIWNAQHGWISIMMHTYREGLASMTPLQSAAADVGLVVAMGSPFIFAMAVAGALKTPAGWRRRFLLLAPLPLAIFFLIWSLNDEMGVQGVSPLVYWLAIPAAWYITQARYRWLARTAAALAVLFGLVVNVALPVLAAQRTIAVPPALDLGRKLRGWPEFVAALEAKRQEAGASYLAGDRYFYSAIWKFSAGSDIPMYDLPIYDGPLPDGVGMFLTSKSGQAGRDAALAHFAEVRPLGSVERPIAPGATEQFSVFVVSKPRNR